MTKVLFLQDAVFEYTGPMQISAILKQAGHSCDLMAWNQEKNLLKSVKRFNPDLIAFSVSTWLYKDARRWARIIKENLDVKTIFGGPHPTFFPQIINDDFVDIICLGEGDYAMLELANNLEEDKDITKIENLYVKKKGKIYKNQIRRLVEDLDKLPFLDREIYYKRYHFLRKLQVKKFMSGRGCPYNCSFCFNYQLKLLNKDKGVYVRKRSQENLIQEIKQVRERYGLKEVRFSDDTFTFNKEWLKKFLKLYKKEIDLPYTCQARANELDETTVKYMSHNCKSTFFAVETGNENLRKVILNKNISNEQIINTAKLLRKYKIKFGTCNMMGLPTETLEDSFETIRINRAIKTDYPHCTIFQPYPGTEITNYALEHDLLPKNFNFDDVKLMSSNNILKLRNKREIMNLHKFFHMAIRFPSLEPVIKKLIKLPQNPVYSTIWKIWFANIRYKSTSLSLTDTIRLSWNLRKSV